MEKVTAVLVTVKIITLFLANYNILQQCYRTICLPSFQRGILWWKCDVLHNTWLDSCILSIFVLAE